MIYKSTYIIVISIFLFFIIYLLITYHKAKNKYHKSTNKYHKSENKHKKNHDTKNNNIYENIYENIMLLKNLNKIYMIIAYVLLFAIIYQILGTDHFKYDNNGNHFINNLFLSITTQTSLGTSDIKPKTLLAKSIIAVQTITVFMYLYFA
jgi:hypothetical protein